MDEMDEENLLYPVKINKRKPPSSRGRMLEEGTGKGSLPGMSVTGKLVNYRPLTEESSGEKSDQLQAPRGKDIHCISHKKSTTPATQPFGNHHDLDFCYFFPPNGLLFGKNPPSFILLLHKIMFLFVCCMSRIGILLFLKKTIFLLVK